jgi:tRNA(Leu) C34 or U34 (ribose-2'-O)-methylase TrmL
MNHLNNSQVTLGICDPKSPTNIGAVMRAAGCYAVGQVLYTGERFDRAVKFQTDTKKVAGQIPLTAVESFVDYKTHDVKMICVELAEGAQSLLDFVHPQHAIYIFGPEDGSVEQSLIDQADAVVYIPTMTCMNLAATVNVVLYDRMAKMQKEINQNLDHTEQIKKSRDVNNRLVVKPLSKS